MNSSNLSFVYADGHQSRRGRDKKRQSLLGFFLACKLIGFSVLLLVLALLPVHCGIEISQLCSTNCVCAADKQIYSEWVHSVKSANKNTGKELVSLHDGDFRAHTYGKRIAPQRHLHCDECISAVKWENSVLSLRFLNNK